MRQLLALAPMMLVLSACGSAASTASGAPATTPTAAPETTAPSATVAITQRPAADSAVIGTWVRTQSCEEALAAFEAAGLEDQTGDWIVGNWVGEGETRARGEECDGARPPEEHSHFFTEDWMFGSLDAAGDQVDFGDFDLVDEDTLSFASHSQEFGYDGDILLDYAVDGDTATFTVDIPSTCEDACRVAHAWALSAFFDAEEWTRRN